MVFAFQMQSTVVAIFRELEDFPTWLGRPANEIAPSGVEGESDEEESDGDSDSAVAEDGVEHPLLGMRPATPDHGKLRGMTTVICLGGARPYPLLPFPSPSVSACLLHF
jgi:hypothetical protein